MPEDKYIFVTGGVLSGLGKGLVAASVSKLLQLRNVEIEPVKCDGYLNVDPGTMNPEEHGEVYVLEDGTEVDMDFGHYERFLDIELTGERNLTSGKIFQEVIQNERNGDYLGETVQMIPHVTDLIKQKFKTDADVTVIEVGGTVGDIENMLYLEALRQLQGENSFHIHVTLVPYLETTGEQKTKPTQHSVKELRSIGLQPDMIVGRNQERLEEDIREKISLFTDVGEDSVISDPNLDTVYRLPLVFDRQDVDKIIAEDLSLPERSEGLEAWSEKVENIVKPGEKRIGVYGKYTGMDDSYASIEEAVKHSEAETGVNVELEYIDSENPEDPEKFDGIIIPGGFGQRGIEGKIQALKKARENGIPALGLCLGMQLMVIEFCRNILGMDATSGEFDQEGRNVVKQMPEQEDVEQKGGTMRLGGYEAELSGKIAEIYGSDKVTERHRHRYEVDPELVEKLEKKGLKIEGFHGELPEFSRLENHGFYIGTQAHPEFNSTVENPSPLFSRFLNSL
ncbi:MAG: CTP synthase [Candidatus Nanohaloarchaea archaeon]